MIRVRYQLLFLSFVVLGIYYPSIFSPFCSVDDDRMVNTLLNLESFSLFDLFFPGGSGQYYRPLLYLTFIGDKYLWGLEESFMHLENVVLHLANTLLVFVSVRVLFKRWSGDDGVIAWLPMVAALIFALHPINTEAVNWISGRTDVLACFFVLLSLVFLSCSLGGGNTVMAISAGVALLLGALAKESALFFVPPAIFLVLCYDHSVCTKDNWQVRIMKGAAPIIAMISSAMIYLIMRSMALSKSDKGIAEAVKHVATPSADLINTARIFAKATGFYLKKLFLPLPLNFGIVEVSNLYIVPGVLFFFLLLFLLYKRNLTSFIIIAGFCICAPSFILTVTKLSWTPVAERYLYIPSAMFSIVVASWCISLHKRMNGSPLLAMVFVVLLSGTAHATVTRNIVWQDNYTLFADTAAKSPQFATAKNDMAIALLKRGNKSEAYRILKSVPVENFQLASLNRAFVYMQEGKPEEARRILYERLKEGNGYKGKILESLVKITEQKRSNSVDPIEMHALNDELLSLVKQQYAMTKDPFYKYRMGLIHLQLDNQEAAFECFSSAKMAAPMGSHYRQAAIRLADKFRP